MLRGSDECWVITSEDRKICQNKLIEEGKTIELAEFLRKN